jgi:signal transduction histidine kinase
MQAILDFLILNYLVILAVACVGNIISGIARAISEGSFEVKKALLGIKDLILLGVGYLTFGIFAFVIKDIALADFKVFSAAFAFITIAIIAYKGNSLAINFATLAKVPLPAVLTDLDENVKEIFNRRLPTGLEGSD